MCLRKECWLLLLLSLVLLAEGNAGRLLSRQKRYIGQFGDMIRLATQREALHYNNYGNHCGFQGGDLPVLDEVDRCCRSHDQCYENATAGPCSSSWLGPSFVRYSWDWDDQQLHCGDDDSSPCRLAACLCDVAAANCFASHPWNAEHKRSSIWDVLA